MTFANEPTEVLAPPAPVPGTGVLAAPGPVPGTDALLLSRYRLVSLIGSGGTADVWSARDERRDRMVTIKLLRDRADPETRRRFLDEGLWLEAIEHRGIVRALGRHDVLGLTLIVFEYVEGTTLAEVLARGPVTARQAVAFVRQVASALGALHAHGVLHLDLKPANILVGTDGRARLIDLGIADLIGNTREVVMGTPRYAAPEVRRGIAPGRATDVYGLALIARELLGSTAQDPRVAAVLRFGLREDPARRPSSAHRFALALSFTVALSPRFPRLVGVVRRAALGAAAVVLVALVLALPRLESSVAGAGAGAAGRASATVPNAPLPPLASYAAKHEWQAPYPRATAGSTVEWVVALRNTGTAAWSRDREGARAMLALSVLLVAHEGL
ncbi:MAG: serine/threonine-protein kinase, partial [Chloroflexota bacterium]